MKLLLVEDNESLARDMQSFLEENGYKVETAATYARALEKIDLYGYDAVIVDITLPDGNGLDLLGPIRRKDPATGILMVTAKNAVEDKVRGLERGADDYLTKPFHKAELNARIRSVLRRGRLQGNDVLEAGGVRIDTAAAQAYVGRNDLHLTRKEYELLLYLAVNRNRLLTKESIAEHLWGDSIDQADRFDFIYNHVKNLRKKITAAGGRNCIRSLYGMGYKYVAE